MDTSTDRPHLGLAELPPPVLNEASKTPSRVAGATIAVFALFAGFMIFLWLMYTMAGGF